MSERIYPTNQRKDEDRPSRQEIRDWNDRMEEARILREQEERWKSETIDLPIVKRTPVIERLERNTKPLPYSTNTTNTSLTKKELSGPQRFEYTKDELTELEVQGVLIAPGTRVKVTYDVYSTNWTS